jgi:two-component system, oxyanion-binding sensor
MTETVHAGFIPLIDAAPLIAAHRCGFAAAEGVALDLQRETSWAALRDRFAVGLLDVAHMLAPMPLASNLGLTPLPVQTLVPIALGTGGNTITVARGLWAALQDRGATADFDALRAGRALAEVVAARRAAGQPALTIAVVHPHSVHRYQLAYWLAACDIAPSRDIDVVVLPPPLMPTALQAGQIDAFSAGEPWGSIAQAEGAGHILTTSTRIWSDSPEKVLGVRARWSDARPQTVAGLTRAVRKAALWCDAPANRRALADMLAARDVLAVPRAAIERSLDRRLAAVGGTQSAQPGFLDFATTASSKPWPNQAVFLYAQMVRWQDAAMSEAGLAAARATFRPDLYDAALGTGDETQDSPTGPGHFFDGGVFDPREIAAYLAGFALHKSPTPA